MNCFIGIFYKGEVVMRLSPNIVHTPSVSLLMGKLVDLYEQVLTSDVLKPNHYVAWDYTER